MENKSAECGLVARSAYGPSQHHGVKYASPYTRRRIISKTNAIASFTESLI